MIFLFNSILYFLFNFQFYISSSILIKIKLYCIDGFIDITTISKTNCFVTHKIILEQKFLRGYLKNIFFLKKMEF